MANCDVVVLTVCVFCVKKSKEERRSESSMNALLVVDDIVVFCFSREAKEWRKALRANASEL